MAGEFLSQILVLLAGSLLVLSLVRRFALPPILGYLVVGMLLGPHALGLVAERRGDPAARRDRRRVPRVHARPRVLARAHGRDEVRGARHRRPADAAHDGRVRRRRVVRCGVEPAVAIVLGGALAMASTAIVLRQLASSSSCRARTRVSRVGILLFQDLAFAPLLGLATAVSRMRARRRARCGCSAWSGARSSRCCSCSWSAAGCCGRCFTRSRVTAAPRRSR